MALVIIGSLVTACLLLLQGLHIFRNGNMRPFFERPGDLRRGRPRHSRGARLAATLLYTVPSLAILCILTFALFKNDRQYLFEWLSGHVVGLIGGLFLLVYGLVALLRPDVVLRWVGSAYADRDLGQRSPSVKQFVRALGAFLSAFALFIFRSL